MTALHGAAVGQDSARESFNGLTHGVSRQPLSAIEQAHHHDDAALTSGNATASPDADLTDSNSSRIDTASITVR